MFRRRMSARVFHRSGGAAPASPDGGDEEDTRVDFSNAALYLSALQTIVAVCSCATVSVLSNWINLGGASAVRTLALCSVTGVLLMRKPLRIGRAHGLGVIFSALQPSVALYVATLVVEQLVHTCSVDVTYTPSWRRVVFHANMALLVVSAFLRARKPLDETDLPFLLTGAGLFVVAMLPPPSVALVGPLCQSVGLWEAAERLVRALTFSVLYSAHVYSSTSTTSFGMDETCVSVTRSASASLWVLGAHIAWLPLAVVQLVVLVHARVHADDEPEPAAADPDYASIESANSTDDDLELGSVGRSGSETALDPVAEQQRLLAEPQLYTPKRGVHASGSTTTTVSLPSILGGPIVASTELVVPNAVTPTAPARAESPISEERIGPRAFVNVNEAPATTAIAQEPSPPGRDAAEQEFKDLAAEIANRL